VHVHFQVVVEYETEELDLVLEALERCNAHLTAAIVSKDIVFQNKVRAHACYWLLVHKRLQVKCITDAEEVAPAVIARYTQILLCCQHISAQQSQHLTCVSFQSLRSLPRCWAAR
jgi:hypothetical protein